MALVFVRATSGGAIALSAATAKTVGQIIAASNHRVILRQLLISFNGTSPTEEPVLIQLARQTTAGTVTSVTPYKENNADDETIQTTFSKTATAEPTTTDVLDELTCHPQSNVLIYPDIVIPGGTRLGIICTAPASVSTRWRVRVEE